MQLKPKGKFIKGFKGLYRITSEGIIKSMRTGNLLKPSRDKDGYLKVVLVSKRRNRKTFRVHRLVGKVFISNPKNKPQINHKNGIKTDNRVENLEWVTAKENIRHAFLNKLKVPLSGVNHPNCKLSLKDVRTIIKLLKDKYTQVSIADKYNTHQSTISHINTGQHCLQGD